MHYLSAVFLLGFSTALEEQPPNAETIENQALAQRRAFRSGQVDIDSTVSDFKGGVKKRTYQVTATTWFDGDKVRRDIRRPYPASRQEIKEKTYRESSCFANGQHYWYGDEVLPGGGTLAFRANFLVNQNFNFPMVWKFPHPRLIGMVPVEYPNLVHFQLETILGRPDRQAPTIQRVRWKEMDCWKIEYMRKDGCSITELIAADRGPTPVRLECEFSQAGTDSIDTLETEVAKIDGSTTWFPRRCHFTRTLNGELIREEVLEIKLQHFNKQIADRMFTPQGMDIRPGTHVYSDPQDPRGTLIWDGKSFVPMDPTPIIQQASLSGGKGYLVSCRRWDDRALGVRNSNGTGATSITALFYR